MNKIRVATAWLDGCSGCHMSILDMDERLLELADRIEVVYSPLVDQKEFPGNVDLALVEGAVSSEDDLHKIRTIRARAKILVALGDCAVMANIPAMRNPFGIEAVLDRAYLEHTAIKNQIPSTGGPEIPDLLPCARPIHEAVPVDVFVPGCPPSADVIYYVLTELLEGRVPDVTEQTRFGA
ncbi:MAG TPA: NADP oxidoreductase [bacterium]|nr:NADP oxidoreductase [bacterium]HOL93688.1 NADP oxidoreductase [bacterium]HPP02086.1 NADP oxidoreductase [bacterium]